jgi:hypothetical protein
MAGLSFVCLNHKNYLGRGDQYVDRLRQGVAKHLKVPHTFRVFTEKDVPEGVEGWWGKIALFKDGMIPAGDRVIFADLDSAIVGDLSDFARYDGPLAMLSDFHFPWQHASGVMLWEAGKYHHVWQSWEDAGRPLMRQGDQMWIRFCEPKANMIQKLFPGQIAGYKTDVRGKGIPPNTRIIAWHGEPKPHEMNWLEPLNACIVGGGPSLAENLDIIRGKAGGCSQVWAVNGTHDYLVENHVTPDRMVIVDPQPHCVEFVRKPVQGCRYYLAEQVHADVSRALRGYEVVRFNHQQLGVGTTVGMQAMELARLEGVKVFDVFGMDCSYRDESHHAYPQSYNDGEKTETVTAYGKTWKTALWMLHQIGQFRGFEKQHPGLSITVHGDGLLAKTREAA